MTEVMTDDQIVEIAKNSFPKEYAIIQQSLFNFYHLKNRDDKTPDMEVLQQQLLTGIYSLLFMMSKVIPNELDEHEFFNQIYNIHIK